MRSNDRDATMLILISDAEDVMMLVLVMLRSFC